MSYRVIQPRRGTAASAAESNPVLAVGERGFETDTKRWKTGDGVTAWNTLPYDGGSASIPDATTTGREVLTGTPEEAQTALGASTSGRTVFTGTAAQGRAALAAAPRRIMRPNGPYLACLGDSLQSYGTSTISSSGVASGFPLILRRVEWASGGRVKLSHPQQDPGDTMSDVLNTQLPALLASSQPPNACVIAIGRNDVGSSFNLTNYLAQYEDIANQLFAAGIVPIFFTPMPTGAAGSPTAIADSNLRRLGAGLKALGGRIGAPVYDQYTAIADVTGGIQAAYNQGDNVHLTAPGYKAVADSLIAQGFLNLFPAAVAVTLKDVAHPFDLLAGAGLFRAGSPAGFSVAGTGSSVAYEDPVGGDGIVGRWAKVTKVNGSTAVGAYRWTSAATAITPGKLYRVSGVMKLSGVWNVEATPASYIQVVAEWRTATATTVSRILVNRWDATETATFTEDIVAPTGVDGLRIVAYLTGTAAGDQILRVAEWSCLNLTDMGL